MIFRALFLALPLLAACVDDGPDRRLRPGGSGSTDTNSPPTATWGTGTTPSTALDCALVPSGPVASQEFPIATEEDFAFDGQGHLLYQVGSTIVGSGPQGGTWIAGTGAPGDPSGLAMRTPRELLIAAPDSGSLELLDLDTGGIETLMGGLEGPDGLTADLDGRIFVSERLGGRVLMLDLDTDQLAVVAEGLDHPNGLALNDSGDLLYVAAADGIYEIARTDAAWTRPESPHLVHPTSASSLVLAVAVDLCGLLYTIDYATGEVLRIDPDSGDSTLLVDLVAGASFGFGTLEFGNGGTWPRGTLFTSNRRVVTGIQVGIPGVTPVAAGAR